jgi:hypothetical protein
MIGMRGLESVGFEERDEDDEEAGAGLREEEDEEGWFEVGREDEDEEGAGLEVDDGGWFGRVEELAEGFEEDDDVFAGRRISAAYFKATVNV